MYVKYFESQCPPADVRRSQEREVPVQVSSFDPVSKGRGPSLCCYFIARSEKLSLTPRCYQQVKQVFYICFPSNTELSLILKLRRMDASISDFSGTKISHLIPENRKAEFIGYGTCTTLDSAIVLEKYPPAPVSPVVFPRKLKTLNGKTVAVFWEKINKVNDPLKPRKMPGTDVSKMMSRVYRYVVKLRDSFTQHPPSRFIHASVWVFKNSSFLLTLRISDME
ncbi:hypothetical protein TNCV_4498071 [Trichonephila clavipes]|nr:hypothetical protein TNCV_4498071 [Trichonephila clavipes]